jgi:hypothetical protein
MRSRLLERWFGHAGGGGGAPARRLANSRVTGGPDRKRPDAGVRVAGARSQRLCLGIGDGSVHRQ